MTDLAALYPSLVGVSIVPAGITNYREGLCHLEPFTAEEAGEVIDTIDKFGEKCLKKFGTRLFFSSDELYIEAGRELPGEDYYEGYPQIENGVGMIRSMDGEFTDELDFLDEYDLEKPRKVSVATGAAAYDFIKSLADRLCEQVPTLECHVYKIINDFFGHNITVAGLLTGQRSREPVKWQGPRRQTSHPARDAQERGRRVPRRHNAGMARRSSSGDRGRTGRIDGQ